VPGRVPYEVRLGPTGTFDNGPPLAGTTAALRSEHWTTDPCGLFAPDTDWVSCDSYAAARRTGSRTTGPLPMALKTSEGPQSRRLFVNQQVLIAEFLRRIHSSPEKDVFFLCGEGGIGKSSLLDQFEDRYARRKPHRLSPAHEFCKWLDLRELVPDACSSATLFGPDSCIFSEKLALLAADGVGGARRSGRGRVGPLHLSGI